MGEGALLTIEGVLDDIFELMLNVLLVKMACA